MCIYVNIHTITEINGMCCESAPWAQRSWMCLTGNRIKEAEPSSSCICRWFATSAFGFSLQNLSLFFHLRPPLTFQWKYYNYSFKQGFLAHFGCLRRPVVMAAGQGIFLRNRTRVSLGTESAAPRKEACSQTTPIKPPASASFSCFLSSFLTTRRRSIELLENVYTKLRLPDLCTSAHHEKTGNLNGLS